jgi:nitrous oxide reductase accessory protein NosL
VAQQEKNMSKTVKTILALSLVAFVAACAQQQEPPPPAPISVTPEPVYNKF